MVFKAPVLTGRDVIQAKAKAPARRAAAAAAGTRATDPAVLRERASRLGHRLERSMIVQAKLAMDTMEGEHELGADRVAREVARSIRAAPVQATSAGDSGGYGDLVEAAQVERAPQRLDATGIPATVRAKMEAAFAADFSGVRVHPGSARAAALRAVAYTQGSDIHVAPGHWAPDTTRGQELLGHELAHVVQQRTGRVRATAQIKGVALNDDPALEREADGMGARAARWSESVQRGAFAWGHPGEVPDEAGERRGSPLDFLSPLVQQRELAPPRRGSPGQTIQGNFFWRRFMARAGNRGHNEAQVGSVALKRKYYAAAMLPLVRKLFLPKPKPVIWNKELETSKVQGSFTFDIIEAFDDAALDYADPVREADRIIKREEKAKEVYNTLEQWRKKYAYYRESGYLTEDQIAISMNSHGEDIAYGIQEQLDYVDDQDKVLTATIKNREEQLAIMGVAKSNQRTFVIARYGDTIAAIGSAIGGYIDHVVANPDSQIPRQYRPSGAVSGGGRAVTHKLARMMIKKGLRPTVDPQSTRAMEGLHRYFTPWSPHQSGELGEMARQQRTGRVRATVQRKGVPLNEDPALEREADGMGARAALGAGIATQKMDAMEAGAAMGGARSSERRPT